jgi:hypothetical protein
MTETNEVRVESRILGRLWGAVVGDALSVPGVGAWEFRYEAAFL